MHEGTWTLRPCPRREVEALAGALGISEMTASVLVRRGYGDPTRRASLSEGARRSPTTRSCSATWPLPATPSARRSQQGGASACTATTTWTASARRRSPSRRCASSGPTSTGTCRAGSRRDTACRARRSRRLAAEGYGLVLTVDCGITAVEQIAGAKALGLDGRDQRPPPSGRRSPRLPDRRDAALDYPVPGALRDGRGLQARSGARRAERAGSTSISSRWRPIADVVPLVDENRGLVARGSAAACRTTERPGLAALMRTAGVDAATVDAGAVGFRLAPRINAAGRLGHPGAALRLLLTDDRREAARLAGRARDAEPRSSGGRGRGSSARPLRQVAEWPDAQRRRRGVRPLGRGLAPGRDRDRRVAPRRALPPAGRPHRRRATTSGRAPGGRSRLRSARGARRLRGRARALRRAPGRRRALDPPDRVEAFAEAFATHAGLGARGGRSAPARRGRRGRSG